MYSRETFARQRMEERQVERRAGAALAIVSVGLGLAQLVFLRWADVHLERPLKIGIALPVFLVYIAVVGCLLWRFERRRREARPKCPGCGAVLEDLSQRIAMATGRCDTCGGQVLE
jgi:hypothetical protein